ncbi:MAG: hypothetical protein ACK5MR_11445 [Cumulibacter sp.]
MPAARDFYAMYARQRRWWHMFTFSRSRHSFAWLRQAGQQPRPAIALVLSL